MAAVGASIAGNGDFVNSGGEVRGAYGGETQFSGSSSAVGGDFINQTDVVSHDAGLLAEAIMRLLRQR